MEKIWITVKANAVLFFSKTVLLTPEKVGLKKQIKNKTSSMNGESGKVLLWYIWMNYIYNHIYINDFFDSKFKKWLHLKDEGSRLFWLIGCGRSEAVLLPEHSLWPTGLLPGSWDTCSCNIPSRNPALMLWKAQLHVDATLVDSLEWAPTWISHLGCAVQSNFQMVPSDFNCMRKSKWQPHSWAESTHRTMRDN